jgi:alpha-beta hydrolase superfamily lysophospholipase
LSNTDVFERGNSGVLFGNETMDFLAAWLLGYAQQGGMSPGSLLHAYARIKDGDPASWSASFQRSADAARARASMAEGDQRAEEASTEWLAAAVAQRAALAMMDPTTDAARNTTAAMQAAFRAFLVNSGTAWEPWEIVLGAARLPAYRTPDFDHADRLAVIIGGGDTYVEDLWFFGAKTLLDDGWAVVAVDLPGQGSTPDQGLHFGPDTLSAMYRVFEAIRERGFSGETVLIGWSGGGIFVTKYASVARSEDRLRAVVASAPVYDAAALFRNALPSLLRNDPSSPLARLAIRLARRNKVVDAAMARYQWQFGPDGIAGVITKFADLGRTDIAAINLPVLALVGLAEDAESRRQAEAVIAGVLPRYPASELVTFDACSGASAHCQVGNLPLALARAVRWLDDIFAT